MRISVSSKEVLIPPNLILTSFGLLANEEHHGSEQVISSSSLNQIKITQFRKF